ncbi:PQQ-binding-like beta-propeller repeat protein [Trichloromonas sp.]|uniref:outer membrane protein assembly factor BamB family protein n=1 Tax=Trichloromonas sp. TaxID=3069249 RepID=UPI003D817040
MESLPRHSRPFSISPMACLCLLSALLLFCGTAAALAAGDQSMFRGNAHRTGYLAEGPQPPLALKWKFKTRHGVREIESFPAVDDGLSPASVNGGVVYVGGHDGYVYALDVEKGTLLWEFATGGRVVSTPTFHDGVVYAGSTDNYLYALNAGDGTRLWRYKSGVRQFRTISYRGIRSSPLIADGVVYVGGCDGRIRALDAKSGRLRWLVDTGTEGSYASPTSDGGDLYVGSDGLKDSHLFALKADTGEVRWKFPVPRQIYATPALADGILYVHVRDDHVYALRASDGSLVWKTPAAAPQGEAQVFTDLSKSSPAVAPQMVYVGIGNDLVALERTSGKVKWRAATGRKVDSSPLVVGDTVYVGSDDRSVYGFAAGSGKNVWSFATGGKVSISPSVGEDLLLIGSNDGFLYAFGTVSTP